MRLLSDLLREVQGYESRGYEKELSIRGVAIDSRKVEQGFLFIAIKGSSMDGHLFIDQAISNGAIAVLCESWPNILKEGVVYLKTEHSASDGAALASAFYGHPSRHLSLVGVTGTNGKTSVSTMLYQTFARLGYGTGLISTVEIRIKDQVTEATHTTPDPVTLQALLAAMLEAGCSHVFMEVSSHACDQDRIAGLKFAGAVFTNLSHDHLDYHKTFDHYLKSKKKFFDRLDTDAFALVNADDKRGQVMLQNCRAKHQTFALKQMADFKAKIMDISSMGLQLSIENRPFYTRLTGAFNAYNLLAVYGVACLLGEEKERVLQILSGVEGARGRLEWVPLETAKFKVLVDYAHTPDALQNVLECIRGFRKSPQQIVAVFGCGGDRDKGKRPIMAALGARLADKVIFTADNPRTEDPESIINEMMNGVIEEHLGKVLRMADRRTAIQTALMMANPGDIILIAGKGHETYQEINGIRYPFDDRQIVKDILKGLPLS